MDARYHAVKLLGRTFGRGGYSNILLNSLPDDMDDREKRLCTAIYYGVLERRLTLDYIISGYCRQGISKLRPDLLNILRAGIYQLMFMDSVPDSAAVNESVNLAKKLRLGSLSGLVNGVLRSFIRDGKKVVYPDEPVKRLSVEYSVPIWFAEMISLRGEEGLSLLTTSFDAPPVTVRLNTAVYSCEEALREMEEMNPVPTFLDNCFEVSCSDITKTSAYKKGMMHVQDISSQLCCLALAPEEGDTVMDMCAAPGGKSFTMAELMNGGGTVRAFDLHEKRAGLIRRGAERLKLDNITAVSGDASVFDPNIPKADKILCDVPCSGLGVIRRKPEIRYKPFEEFRGLPEVQYAILENAARYLKDGGELVYSTCTVNPEENEEVVERFLAVHREFKGVSFLEEYGAPFGTYKATIFPCHFGSDGFFISKMKLEKDN